MYLGNKFNPDSPCITKTLLNLLKATVKSNVFYSLGIKDQSFKSFVNILKIVCCNSISTSSSQILKLKTILTIFRSPLLLTVLFKLVLHKLVYEKCSLFVFSVSQRHRCKSNFFRHSSGLTSEFQTELISGVGDIPDSIYRKLCSDPPSLVIFHNLVAHSWS